MKRLMYLSLACAAVLNAADAKLDPIEVEATKLSDVSGEEIKSADLAEALNKKVPSASLVRRSGIANDVILRGQKKDNINVIIDGTKIYGACPNRMDPPTSHVVTHNVESIEIVKGPYDVEHFGTLSGGVFVETNKPKEGFHGNLQMNVGSFGYKKVSATVGGGNDKVRFLFGAAQESGEQYEDGDGNTFADQVDNYVAIRPAIAGTAYQPMYRDLDAFKKRTFMGKLFVDVADNQELKLEMTRNQSDDVLYPTSKMDALYDDSDILNLEYAIHKLGRFSKTLSAQVYHTEVEHPMSTKFRKMAIANGEVTSLLNTEVEGVRVKNSFDATEAMEVTVGIDASDRFWGGEYYKNGNVMKYPNGDVKRNIPDVDTKNRAVFAEMLHQVGNFNYKAGIRFDDTTVEPGSQANGPTLPALQDNDYSSFSANVFGTYRVGENLSFYGGVGKSSRVPDGKELYFLSSMGGLAGSNTLEQTTNYGLDLGMKNQYENFTLDTRVFYSMLEDYIYFNADKMANKYENIDATIYGIEISGAYYPTEALSVDFGLAYLRGEKDEALSGQTDTDLAEIPPLKGNVALTYEYAAGSTARVELVASDEWSDYDADNGEQAIDAWSVLNLKVEHQLAPMLTLAVGVDNVTDEAYAITNTYKDLILLMNSDPDDEVILMNEPGRYYYANLRLRF